MFFFNSSKKKEVLFSLYNKKKMYLRNKKTFPPFIRIIYSKYLLLQLCIILSSHRHVSSSSVLSYSHLSPSSFLTLPKEVGSLEGNT